MQKMEAKNYFNEVSHDGEQKNVKCYKNLVQLLITKILV